MGSIRLLLALACLGWGAAALAQTPPAPLSAEDEALVYRELLDTHDGMQYEYYVVSFTSEQQARSQWEQLQQPPRQAMRFDRIYPNVKPFARPLYLLPPAIRERIVNMPDKGRFGPVHVPTRNSWVILELIGTKLVQPHSLEQVRPVLGQMVASGEMPSAAQLRSDAALRARSLLNRVRTVEDLRGVPEGLDVNTRLSSEDLLLVRSIGEQRLDLAEALLKRGANPNLCARSLCPLQVAIYREPRAVEILLAAGAKVDQNDPARNIHERPLNTAARTGNVELAGRLLAAGASPEGAGRETPLMIASAKGARPMAELLISKGADPFAVSRSAPEMSALDYAHGGKHTAYAAWLESVMLKQAETSGRFAWQGWIEQDGRRHSIEDAPIQLRRAPFRVIVRTQPGVMLFVSAGTERSLQEQLKSPDSPLRSNMTISAEDNDGKSTFLVVHEPQPGQSRWGGSQSWWHKDAKETRYSVVAETPQGREYAREVRDLIIIDKSDKSEEVTLEKSRVGQIFLVVGSRIPMSFAADSVYQPRTVELRFGR